MYLLIKEKMEIQIEETIFYFYHFFLFANDQIIVANDVAQVRRVNEV